MSKGTTSSSRILHYDLLSDPYRICYHPIVKLMVLSEPNTIVIAKKHMDWFQKKALARSGFNLPSLLSFLIILNTFIMLEFVVCVKECTMARCDATTWILIRKGQDGDDSDASDIFTILHRPIDSSTYSELIYFSTARCGAIGELSVTPMFEYWQYCYPSSYHHNGKKRGTVDDQLPPCLRLVY